LILFYDSFGNIVHTQRNLQSTTQTDDFTWK
jgi:hypothetical protein